ncbi:hypothetical protein [Acidilobus saccharovorans]|uniref:hypothetical protein n=1 Tax=Acidilobus saccharovorans TaxID=242703 RepID=UPI003B8365D2
MPTLEDLHSRTPHELIDLVLIRLELIEKTASEMAKDEKSAGKLLAIVQETESIRELLAVLRDKCR